MLALTPIPGYAEALRAESDARRRAYLPGLARIAGVPVRALTLRDMLWLEEMRNGFFCPWRFDSDDELRAHCAQLVWWLSASPKPDPNQSDRLGYSHLRLWLRRHALIRRLAACPTLATETIAYIKAAFADAPKGSSDATSTRSATALPPSVCDLLAAAGHALHPDEVMDLPLVQLWQIIRLARARLTGEPLTNPSDQLACDFLAAQAVAASKGGN